jgi:hypothetical protein
MKHAIISAAVALSLLAGAADAGCIKGAVVGAVAGHFAHHHALAGAAVGCVVGHEMSVHKRKQLEAERREAHEQAH